MTNFRSDGIFKSVANKEDNTPVQSPLMYTIEQLATVTYLHTNSSIAFSNSELEAFLAGSFSTLYQRLGPIWARYRDLIGVYFCLWAPNAKEVSIIGDFNHWNEKANPMTRLENGFWAGFIAGDITHCRYKYCIEHKDHCFKQHKIDPLAHAYEYRPHNAAKIHDPAPHAWQDNEWLAARNHWNWQDQPLSIYEVHLGSWHKDVNNRFLNYRELAHRLVPYVTALGFTHVEVLPITEFPLDDSWGYQTTGYFAPTSRYGSAEDFKYFVDYLHQHAIGVFLDWVPAHFPKDEHALARYDGGALYEYENPQLGEHKDWGTYIPNYARHEVKNFLLSSARYWLEVFHIDGIRVDAVASMLYLNYSRKVGEWQPNIYGGVEHLAAIEFIKELNQMVTDHFPNVLMMAEESTCWWGVTESVNNQGLGFTHKWNLGWMHDTLGYVSTPPVRRTAKKPLLNLAQTYAFSEKFILPLSHDEVVHEKRSMIEKMPGNKAEKFSNLRLLYTHMFTLNGAKLLFMGNEIAQNREWNHNQSLDWDLLDEKENVGIQRLICRLNYLYRHISALYKDQYQPNNIQWLEQSEYPDIVCYQRESGQSCVLIIINFSNKSIDQFTIHLRKDKQYRVLLNTHEKEYSGTEADIFLVTGKIIAANSHAGLTLDLTALTGLVLEAL